MEAHRSASDHFKCYDLNLRGAILKNWQKWKVFPGLLGEEGVPHLTRACRACHSPGSIKPPCFSLLNCSSKITLWVFPTAIYEQSRFID